MEANQAYKESQNQASPAVNQQFNQYSSSSPSGRFAIICFAIVLKYLQCIVLISIVSIQLIWNAEKFIANHILS